MKYFLKLPYIFIFMLFIGISLAESITAREQLVASNNEYLISASKGDDTILIFNGNEFEIDKIMDIHIDEIDICATYPFVYLKGISKNDKEYKQRLIYDIEEEITYDITSSIDNNEEIWSEDGKYTYLKTWVFFVLIRTENLRRYLKGDRKDIYCKITGDPGGLIGQNYWKNRYLIYWSGVPGRECFGYYDLKKEQNYFISCCGVKGVQEFEDQCGGHRSDNYRITKMIKAIEKNNAVEITNNFFNEFSEIIRSRKSARIRGSSVIRDK